MTDDLRGVSIGADRKDLDTGPGDTSTERTGIKQSAAYSTDWRPEITRPAVVIKRPAPVDLITNPSAGSHMTDLPINVFRMDTPEGPKDYVTYLSHDFVFQH